MVEPYEGMPARLARSLHFLLGGKLRLAAGAAPHVRERSEGDVEGAAGTRAQRLCQREHPEQIVAHRDGPADGVARDTHRLAVVAVVAQTGVEPRDTPERGPRRACRLGLIAGVQDDREG